MSTRSVLDSPIVSTVIFVALLVGITAAWHYLPSQLVQGIETVEGQGAYGDRYGSVNALFTGLAFAALLFTILLQQRELRLQREDIANQMREMQLSRDEVHRQVVLLERQNQLNLATLRMKPLEAKISEIQMLAERWVPGAKADNAAPMIAVVKDEMDQIIRSLERDA